MKTFLLVPFLLGVAALACTGTPNRMQIVDEPIYVCPSATPRATDTPVPTAAQPPINVPPSGWATHTPVPGCIWRGYGCATNTPRPGGMYRTPGYTLPAPTSTPRPTTTPYPTPTLFTLRPPQDFFVGDAVYTGGLVSSPHIRLRLLNIQTLSASPAADGSLRSLATWELQIKNIGPIAYETFPAWQMVITLIETANGEVAGVWAVSRAAAVEAGVSTALEAVALAPGETRIFPLAAYIPAGVPRRFAYALDPTTRQTPAAPGLPGTNILTWTNTTNNVCAGELAEPSMLSTSVR